jgi:CheY-like chemotaxis protein
VIKAENGNQGITLFREYRPHLIVTDLVMPEKEGLETIIDLKKIDPAVKIIAVSGGGRNVPEIYLEFARKMGVKGRRVNNLPKCSENMTILSSLCPWL